MTELDDIIPSGLYLSSKTNHTGENMETLDEILRNLQKDPNAYNHGMNEEDHIRLDVRREL